MPRTKITRTRRTKTKAPARVLADGPAMGVKADIPPEYKDAGVHVEPLTGVLLIPLALVLESPYQTRSVESIKDDDVLTASIKANEQIVPAEVRPVYIQEGKATDKTHQRLRFEILHGHRRFRVLNAQDRGLLRATVRQASDAEAAMIVLAENQGRRDLTPMEIARAAERLEKDGLKQENIGQILGRSQSNVANMLRVIRTIPKDVLAKVDAGLVTFTALRPLLPFLAADGHLHDEDIRRLVERGIPHMVQVRDRHDPPVTEDRMKDEVQGRLGGWFMNTGGKPKMARWRPLDAKAAKIYDRHNPSARQRPQMAEYLKRAEGRVHDFGPFGKWACDADAWKHAADAEARKRDGTPETAPKEDAGPDTLLDKAVGQAGRLQQRILKAIGVETVPEATGTGVDPEYVEAVGKPIDLRTTRRTEIYSLPEKTFSRAARDGLRIGDTANNAATSGDSVFPYGKSVALVIDDFRPDMADHAECTRDCVKGRMVGILPFTGRGNLNGRIAKICTNPECAIAKLAAGRVEREMAAGDLASKEAATIQTAATRFPTLDRGPALMLLAVLTDIASVPTGEESQYGGYGRGERIAAIELMRKQLGDAVEGVVELVKRGQFGRTDLVLHPEELGQVLAETSDEDLSRMVYDLAIGAVRDEHTGEHYQPRAGVFAELVLSDDAEPPPRMPGKPDQADANVQKAAVEAGIVTSAEEAEFDQAGEAAVGVAPELQVDPGEDLMATAYLNAGVCRICELKYAKDRTYKTGLGMRNHVQRQHPHAWARFQAVRDTAEGIVAAVVEHQEEPPAGETTRVIDRMTVTGVSVGADGKAGIAGTVEASHEEPAADDLGGKYQHLSDAVVQRLETAMADGTLEEVKADILETVQQFKDPDDRRGWILEIDAVIAEAEEEAEEQAEEQAEQPADDDVPESVQDARQAVQDASADEEPDDGFGKYDNLAPAVVAEMQGAIVLGPAEAEKVKVSIIDRIMTAAFDGETRKAMLADLEAVIGQPLDTDLGKSGDDAGEPQVDILEQIHQLVDPKGAHKAGPLHCPMCERITPTLKGMGTHIRMVHPDTWKLYKASRS